MSKKTVIDKEFSVIPLERDVLSGLFKFPEVFSEVISFLDEQHFEHKNHKNIFSLLRQAYEKAEKINNTVLAQRMTNLQITSIDQIPINDYIDDLFHSQIRKEAVVSSVKQLISNYSLKELAINAQNQYRFIIEHKNANMDVVINGLDKIYHQKTVKFFNDLRPVKLFENARDTLNLINHKFKTGDAGLPGPFKTVNALYGSLHRPGNITLIGADSGVGKTQFGLFYNLWMCVNHNIPVLHCDAGEMSREELYLRALCSLSKGKLTYYALESGLYKENVELNDLVNYLMPKVENLPIFYEDVSGLTPDETISLFRKYSFNTFGRNQKFIINYDYLKPFERLDDENAKEWQVLRDFTNRVKKTLVNEIPWVSFWTSLQLNASGAVKNRNSSDIDDSANSLALSKAIRNSVTHGIILRPKTPDEIQNESPDMRYGNFLMKWFKHRHLGEKANRALTKVLLKGEKDKLVENHINLFNDSFYFEDRGDVWQMAQEMQNNLVDISHDNPDDARLE